MRQKSVIFPYSRDIFARMKWFRIFLCITLAVFFFASCENEQEPLVMTDCDPATPVTYTNSISKILTDNCLGCHHAGGAVPNLDTYVKASSSGEQIIVAVNHSAGIPMPQGGAKLDDATLKKFDCWKASGFKE